MGQAVVVLLVGCARLVMKIGNTCTPAPLLHPVEILRTTACSKLSTPVIPLQMLAYLPSSLPVMIFLASATGLAVIVTRFL